MQRALSIELYSFWELFKDHVKGGAGARLTYANAPYLERRSKQRTGAGAPAPHELVAAPAPSLALTSVSMSVLVTTKSLKRLLLRSRQYLEKRTDRYHDMSE
jgi:hypothetical protein